MKIKRWIVMAGMALSAMLLAANAATVSWSAEQIDTAGSSQISNTGTLMEAGVLGTNSLTLGGVTFERMYYSGDFTGQTYFQSASGQNLLGGGWVSGTYTAGVNPDYAGIFERYRYTGTPDTTLTITNLTVGNTYQIQLFVADLRGISSLWDRVVQMDGTVFNADGWIATGGNGSGAIVTGTFLADATSQTFTMNIYDLSSEAAVSGWNISAYQIRNIPAVGQISWSAEQITTTGTDQISTNGMCIEAAVLGNGDVNGVTVGGVTFDRLYGSADFAYQTYFRSESSGNLLYGSSWVSDSCYDQGVNPDYADLLNDYRYTGGLDRTLTLTNLVVGQEYLIQLFVADLRNISSIQDRCVEMDGIILDPDGRTGTAGGDSGTIVSGTFTANASSQTFTMNIHDLGDSANATGWNIGAYQIRLLSADLPWKAEQIAAGGTAQISTSGSLVEAAYFGTSDNGTTNKTVGGVPFQSGVAGMTDTLNYIQFPSVGAYSAFYPTGNADLTDIMAGAVYSGTPGSVFTLKNLTVGTQYEVQLFSADTRTSSTMITRTAELDGHALAESEIGLGGTGVNALGNGTVITAIFTASAISQDIAMSLWRPDSAEYVTGLHLNAYQIRDLSAAVPAPATMSMAVSGSSIIVTVGDMEGNSSITNTLQARADLMTGTWTNLYSVSGVTSTNWTLPMDDSQGFFRVLSTD